MRFVSVSMHASPTMLTWQVHATSVDRVPPEPLLTEALGRVLDDGALGVGPAQVRIVITGVNTLVTVAGGATSALPVRQTSSIFTPFPSPSSRGDCGDDGAWGSGDLWDPTALGPRVSADKTGPAPALAVIRF